MDEIKKIHIDLTTDIFKTLLVEELRRGRKNLLETRYESRELRDELIKVSDSIAKSILSIVGI